MIDAHHHLWQYHPDEYHWMDDSMDVLKRDYLPEELEPQLDRAGVCGTIVVQARQSLRETSWLLEMWEAYSFIKGVVGWVDLCSPGVGGQLEALASRPGLKGVRHVIHDEPDKEFMLRQDFRMGLSQLQKFSLVYDLLLLPVHLPGAITLVRQFPDQLFVLDHLGKPDIRSGAIQRWKKELKELARCPNVSCKLSGIVTEAGHRSWRYADLEPYMDAALEAFSPSRLMMGSDWPVCLLAGTYGEVMGACLRFIGSLSKEEQRCIVSQNARDIYQL